MFISFVSQPILSKAEGTEGILMFRQHLSVAVWMFDLHLHETGEAENQEK
jgi:hypothetical protein